MYCSNNSSSNNNNNNNNALRGADQLWRVRIECYPVWSTDGYGGMAAVQIQEMLDLDIPDPHIGYVIRCLRGCTEPISDSAGADTWKGEHACYGPSVAWLAIVGGLRKWG